MSKSFARVAGVPLFRFLHVPWYAPLTRESQGIVVMNPMVQAKTRDVVALLSTAGFVNNTLNCIICLDGCHGEEHVMSEVNEIFSKKDWRDTTFMLYDATGVYDDIACVKSEQIAMRSSWKVHPLTGIPIPMPVLAPGGFSVPEEKAERIRKLARYGSLHHVMDATVFGMGKEMGAENMSAAIAALSFGNVSVEVKEADFLSKEELGLDEERAEDPICSAEFVESGVVADSEENVRFVKDLKRMHDVSTIWRRCIRDSGMPVELDFHDGRKCEPDMIRKLGEAIGADSAVDAYFAGVPLEDIFA